MEGVHQVEGFACIRIGMQGRRYTQTTLAFTIGHQVVGFLPKLSARNERGHYGHAQYAHVVHRENGSGTGSHQDAFGHSHHECPGQGDDGDEDDDDQALAARSLRGVSPSGLAPLSRQSRCPLYVDVKGG